MFSTSCHYGLQAMIYIALKSTEEQKTDLSQISENQNIPKHFLSKILQKLVKNGLLNSMKGPTGGFYLSKKPDEIVLIDVIGAIDGMDVFNKCGIGFKKCDDNHPCPIHHEYKGVRNNIRELFENKTLLDLSEEIRRGESFVSLSSDSSLNS
jgi:Rrf2 family protein